MPFCKNHSFLYFDNLRRSQKAETLNCLIHASYQANAKANKKEDRKEVIAKLLKNAYDLYGINAGSYVGDVGQFDSQYTIGHELGIWTSSYLELNRLAEKVATYEITIKEYFDIVFLNYIQPIDNIICHPLYAITKYAVENSLSKITKDDMRNVFSWTSNNANNNINGLFNMLLGSSYFAMLDDKTLSFTCKPSELLKCCNTEYLSSPVEEVKDALNDIRSYVSYLIRDHRSVEIIKNLQVCNNSKNSYEDVFNHNLFGIHIKEENNALSESNPHVCIGWSILGDLSNIESKEDLASRYDLHFDKNNRGRGQDIGQIWRFLHDINVGDYIIFAEHSEFHIGRIESNYFYDDSPNPNQSPDYKNTRVVKWLMKNISRSVLSSDLHNSLKTAMSIWSINDYKSAVVDLLRGTYQKDEERADTQETTRLIFKTNLEIPQEWNRIIFGAPGTGKSYQLKEDCEKTLEKFGGSFERVTFHPDYSYSQFVGAYKPIMGSDDNIRYDFVPGPFMRVYVKALKNALTHNPQPHLLVIEEINRAKVASVFGDIFQLLDRDDDGCSVYEIQASEDVRRYLAKEFETSPESFEKIRIPNNMFIWATMNSADQGVFPMDTAFKRRWNFEYLGIDKNEEKISNACKILLEESNETIEWNRLRKAINAKMSSNDFKINEDKLLGPFFLSKKILASNDDGTIINKKAFIDAFKSKVIMYLYEDAVKQGKHRFFEGCPDTSKYSSVCDAFDKIGTKIFGSTFKENYYDKVK